jgi:hypothetical protein
VQFPLTPSPIDAAAIARFWSRIEKTDGCWLWTGPLDHGGYGTFRFERQRKLYVLMAHRIAYEQIIGPIPDGLVLDHLCRVRNCCNPHHLEPVTRGENVLRGDSPNARSARATHCPQGHPYDEANTYRTPNGTRQCRICKARLAREFHERNPTYNSDYAKKWRGQHGIGPFNRTQNTRE